jgi:hypothetical protein
MSRRLSVLAVTAAVFARGVVSAQTLADLTREPRPTRAGAAPLGRIRERGLFVAPRTKARCRHAHETCEAVHRGTSAP